MMHANGILPGPRKVQVEWKVESSRMVIGVVPITVLQLQAIRDCVVSFMHVKLVQMIPGSTCQVMLCAQEPATGKRTLKVHRLGGPGRVIARENLPAQFGEPIENKSFEFPHDFWCWSGQMRLQKGQTFGMLVASSQPAQCEAIIAGMGDI